MEIQKLPEGQRQYLDLHMPPRQVGGKLRGQQVCVGTGDIDVTVKIHPEGIYGVFPAVDPLHFIEKQIHPLSGNDPFTDIPIQVFRGHLRKPHRFKIHFDNLLVRDTAAAQMLRHQLHQAGLSAAAYW